MRNLNKESSSVIVIVCYVFELREGTRVLSGRPGNRGLTTGRCTYFSLLRSIQTDFGAHPAS